jgi:hypothetical protein
MPSHRASQPAMKLRAALVDHRLYLVGGPAPQTLAPLGASCPFCRKTFATRAVRGRLQVLKYNAHACVSGQARARLARRLAQLGTLPSALCSACRRVTATEMCGAPTIADGVLTSGVHTVDTDGVLVSRVTAPSLCRGCVYASRIYPAVTYCECGRTVGVEMRRQDTPDGDVLPTHEGIQSVHMTGDLCATCRPHRMPQPLDKEIVPPPQPRGEGTAVCFACYAVGGWQKYHPFPSSYLIQRMHSLKRHPKHFCPRCIQECRLCGDPALGKDRLCSDCRPRRRDV